MHLSRGRTIVVDKWRDKGAGRGGELAAQRRDYFFTEFLFYSRCPRVLCGRYFSILSYKFDPDSSVSLAVPRPTGLSLRPQLFSENWNAPLPIRFSAPSPIFACFVRERRIIFCNFSYILIARDNGEVKLWKKEEQQITSWKKLRRVD